jgi:Domain of unknown function DUF488
MEDSYHGDTNACAAQSLWKPWRGQGAAVHCALVQNHARKRSDRKEQNHSAQEHDKPDSAHARIVSEVDGFCRVGDDPIDLATSRYQAKDLIIASGLVPVGISIGKPKFPLGYTPLYLREAAPWGLREITDNDEFSSRYVARLNRLGVDLFLQRFAEISAKHDGRGLVLLCYEPARAFCHRRVLGSWYEEQTGQRVNELLP